MAKTKASPTDPKKPTAAKATAKALQPVKKKSGKSNPWTAFVLTNNTITLVKGVKKARTYEEEVGEMIQEKRSFALQSEATEWTKGRESQMKALEPEVSEEPDTAANAFNLDDQAKLDKALLEIDAKRPSDKIEIYFRTSSTSKAVSLIIRCYNVQGRDVWNVKPDGASLALSNFSMVFKQENKYVEQALLNLSYGRMRDLSGDPNKVATKTWTSPSTQTERNFDTYVMTTHFILPPLEELVDIASEDFFIQETCHDLGKAILYILSQDTFARCYQHAIKNERIWNAVIGKSGRGEGRSYIDFARAAKVVVTHCPNFNTHVVKADAAKLCSILLNNTYGKTKYPFHDPDADSDEDEDDGEEPETGLTTPNKQNQNEDKELNHMVNTMDREETRAREAAMTPEEITFHEEEYARKMETYKKSVNEQD